MESKARLHRFASWKRVWAEAAVRRQLYITLPALVLVLLVFARFVAVIEARPGVTLPDPLLATFAAHDVTWLVFAFIYSSTLLGLFFLLSHPRQLLTALRAYILMMIVRMIVMYLTPLEAPVGTIPLIDPLAAAAITGTTLMKDLFFSGHTSTLFLLFLTAQGRALRTFFLSCTIATGTLLLVQHVHYSLDVVAAPFFAYGCYRATVRLSERPGEM